MSLTLRMGDEVINDQATNIQTLNIKDGGYAAVTFRVKRKLDQALFETNTNVMTFDPATGEQTGGGRLLEQGREDDGTWKVTCLGEGLASMQDVTTPVFYADQTMGYWIRSSRTTRRFQIEVGQYPVQSDDEPTLVCTVTEGIVLAVNDEIVQINRLAQLCGQLLGSLGFRDKAGFTNSNFRIRGVAFSADHSSSTTPIDDIWDTTISGRRLMTCDGDFSNKTDAAIVFKRISTVSPTSNEDYWATARDLTICAQIYGRDGTLLTSGHDYTRETFWPQEVLIDWVVRYCPRLNAETGVIGASVEAIEQMAYPDGVHGMQLAADCADVDPAFMWQVWEQDTDGTWPFNYLPLPTTVRYEATTADGFTAPTPSNEVYDEVLVYGKTKAGRDINLLVTRVVPSLVALGTHRRATIELGSELWSSTLATKVGNDFLDEHAISPNAGTITIARPIKDTISNRWIGPQHIRSGDLLRVQGVQPTPNSINATLPDGVTVFRIVSALHDDDSNSTVCELDSYTLTESRAIAAMARSRTRR